MNAPRHAAPGLPLLPGGVGYSPDDIAEPGAVITRHGCPDCGHATPHDIPGDTDGMGSCPDCAEIGQICDLPLGASFEPWTDADAEELAVEMAAAAANRRKAYGDLVAMSRAHRAYLVDASGLTADELATAAARFGIVADPNALPLNAIRRQPVSMAGITWAEARTREAMTLRAEVIDRQRETGDVWAGVEAARAGKTTHEARYYEDSDGFEERENVRAFDRGRRPEWPLARYGRSVG